MEKFENLLIEIYCCIHDFLNIIIKYEYVMMAISPKHVVSRH
jgi:hypothetical protein